MSGQKVLTSWSGGKDSCLACYKAMQQGYDIKYLLNFISQEYQRSCFHGIEAKLLKLQAKLIGLPIIQKEVKSQEGQYEKEFKKTVQEIKKDHPVEKIVFGDIYLDAHKDWVQRICNDLGVSALEPLWGIPSRKVVEEFIDLGFKAIVVSGKSDIFSSEFVGRYIDKNLLKEIEKKDVCPCGEKGEFHTLVIDGPIFKSKIIMNKTRPVLKEGFWSYWFLDIQEYQVVAKN